MVVLSTRRAGQPRHLKPCQRKSSRTRERHRLDRASRLDSPPQVDGKRVKGGALVLPRHAIDDLLAELPVLIDREIPHPSELVPESQVDRLARRPLTSDAEPPRFTHWKRERTVLVFDG